MAGNHPRYEGGAGGAFAHPPVHRVLVLGEKEAARQLLRQLLLHQGLQAILREPEEGALNAIARVKPHLVLHDIGGPSEAELMSLQRIRNCCEPRSMPVVVVLPTRVRAAVARCVQSGANDFLTWPVDWMTWWPRLRGHLFAPGLNHEPERDARAFRTKGRAALGGRFGPPPEPPKDAYRPEATLSSGRRINLRI